MKPLFVHGVNDAYRQGMIYLKEHGVIQDSRAGKVLVLPYPMMTIYGCPTARVLLDTKRKANPYFHLMEAMWMLSGRNDAAFLNNYVHDFGDRFAEPGSDPTLHGAYGYRWRYAFGVDQIEIIIDKLKTNPLNRQLVIQMWSELSQCDLTGGPNGELWRDVPCNTEIYFRAQSDWNDSDQRWLLDMGTNCRSNDIIWGAYGANAVHFSVLHEYIATMAGMAVGKWYQYSWNWHAYVEQFDKVWPPSSDYESFPYVPMINNPEEFDWDLRKVMQMLDPNSIVNGLPVDNPFLKDTVLQMGLKCPSERIGDPAWRRAAELWEQRNVDKK